MASSDIALGNPIPDYTLLVIYDGDPDEPLCAGCMDRDLPDPPTGATT